MNANLNIPTTQEQQVLAIFDKHVAAFNSGSLDAVLDDFSEQSIVITADGVFEGLTQIRNVYRNLLAEFGVIDHGDSAGFTFDVTLVRDDMLVINWHAQSINYVFPYGTDTFVCRNGKVHRQSICFAPPQPR